MSKCLITEKDKKTVHYDGPGDTSYTLCGHDVIGDTEEGWPAAVPTIKQVDCVHCLRIVKYCKSLPPNKPEQPL